jgi:hypothetical protein
MANYNPYYPMGYQPYPYYTAPAPAVPQAQTIQQNQPASIIWVAGEKQAFEYPVAPNNAVALWDSTAPAIYLKTADASGKPTLKTYDLVERTQTHAETQTTDKAEIDLSFFKTALDSIRSELEVIKASVKKEENNE